MSPECAVHWRGRAGRREEGWAGLPGEGAEAHRPTVQAAFQTCLCRASESYDLNMP